MFSVNSKGLQAKTQIKYPECFAFQKSHVIEHFLDLYLLKKK